MSDLMSTYCNGFLLDGAWSSCLRHPSTLQPTCWGCSSRACRNHLWRCHKRAIVGRGRWWKPSVFGALFSLRRALVHMLALNQAARLPIQQIKFRNCQSASWHVVVASSLLHVWVDWLPAPKWVQAQQQEARACRWSSCSLTCGGPDRAGSHLPYQHGIWDWCKVEGLSIVHCIGRRECVKGHFAGGSCLHCCHKWVRKPNCWCSHSGQSTRLNSKVRAPDSCIGVVCKSKSEPLRVVEAARSHPCVEDVLHSSGPCICGCCLASYNPAMQILHGTSSYVFLAMPMLYVHSSLPSLAWAGRP